MGPIANENLIKKIHLNFRAQALLEHVQTVEQMLDSALHQTMVRMIGTNTGDILRGLASDEDYLYGMFDKLRDRTSLNCSEQRVDALLCVQELCSQARHMQQRTKKAMFDALTYYVWPVGKEHGNGGDGDGAGGGSGHGNELGNSGSNINGGGQSTVFFSLLSTILGDAKATTKERLLATDIILNTVLNDPVLLQTFIINNGEHPRRAPGAQEDDAAANVANVSPHHRHYDGKLLQRICARLVGDEEESVQLTCLEILKILLDPSRMNNTKEEFLGIFYDHYIAWLADSLTHGDGDGGDSGDSGGGGGNSSGGSSSSSSNSTHSNSIPRPRADSFALLVGVGGELGDFSDLLREPSTTVVDSSKMDIDHADEEHTEGRKTTPPPPPMVEFDFAFAATHQSIAAKRSSQIQVVDLLCFAVNEHTYRIKYYVLRKNVVGMALHLLKYREKHVQLASVRFATTCIRRNEQFYNRYKELFCVFL